MNTHFGSAFSAGRSQAYPAGPQPTPARTHTAAPQQAAPVREGVPPPAKMAAEIDHSDGALTRRDVPRGSLINIIA